MTAIRFNTDFTHVWVYCAGPFLGSCIGAALFLLLHIHRSVDIGGGGGGGDNEALATDSDPIFSPLPASYSGAAIARAESGRGFSFSPDYGSSSPQSKYSATNLPGGSFL